MHVTVLRAAHAVSGATAQLCDKDVYTANFRQIRCRIQPGWADAGVGAGWWRPGAVLDNAELCILAVMYRFRPVPYKIMRIGVGRSTGTGGRMHCAGEVDNGH